MMKYLSFHNSSFAIKILFHVNGKATEYKQFMKTRATQMLALNVHKTYLMFWCHKLQSVEQHLGL
jgi:hypothetical protein